MDVPDVIREIEATLRNGEVIGAYDRARSCLEAGHDHPRLRYLSVLALARSGATAKAATQYRALRIDRATTDVDSLTLWPRIRKDAAFGAPPARRHRLLGQAARAYFRAYRRTGDDYFPGINAATLFRLMGERDEATRLASALLDDPALRPPLDYWTAATRAEALALLGRWEETARVLREARVLAKNDFGKLSSTRRQLAALLAAVDPGPAIASDLLAVLAPPAVAHLLADRIEPDGEEAVAEAVAAALAEEGVGFAVGTLWTRGALVMAEQALARGAHLHLVLPFGPDDYLAHVATHRPAGEVARRERCLHEAKTVTSATADGDFPDPQLVAYAELIARGLARTRARHLSTECVDIVLGPDAAPPPELPPGRDRLRVLVASGGPAHRPEPLAGSGPERELRCFLFADVYQFSSILESRLPAFWSQFMAGIAEVIDGVALDVLYRNTWGDAFFLVIRDVAAAAGLALAIQDRAAAMRREDRSAPELRIGLHHGPVFLGLDPIRGVPAYFGTQVSRAARVEPVAPPGAVFVTEPFAAVLAATRHPGFEAEYVGRMPLPKKYGEHRMYRLARRWRDAEV